MKIAGFLLLLAGWFLVLAALGMLHPGASRTVFVGAGLAVEAMGLTLAAQAHRALSTRDPSRDSGRRR
jgi:hypothetical protein